MRLKPFFLSACAVILSLPMTNAADNNTTAKYRRSSIYTLMAINPEFAADKTKASALEQVKESFLAAPVPDKYNDHNLPERFIDFDSIPVTEAEIAAIAEQKGEKKKKALGFIKDMVSEVTSEFTGGVVGGINENKVAAQLLKWLNQNRIANKMVAKWYNMEAVTLDGKHFNYDLISERGLYDASAIEAANAEQTVGGLNRIMDAAAGELIPNTFVMVSVYNYLSAKEMTDLTAAIASQFGGYGQLAGMAASAAGKEMKGYFARTNTFLFKLNWTPELQAEFEEKYWDTHDINDLREFMNSDKYKMEYVGKTTDFVPASMKISTNPEEDIKAVDRATVRAIDGAIEKLQKKYEVFKTIAPITIQNGEITAYVGMKEGIEAGDKFDVFEYVMNEDGTTSLNKVGEVKAKKKCIWDNRYGAGEKIEGAADDDDDDEEASLSYTTFEGKASKFMDGMFIRQQK